MKPYIQFVAVIIVINVIFLTILFKNIEPVKPKQSGQDSFTVSSVVTTEQKSMCNYTIKDAEKEVLLFKARCGRFDAGDTVLLIKGKMP